MEVKALVLASLLSFLRLAAGQSFTLNSASFSSEERGYLSSGDATYEPSCGCVHLTTSEWNQQPVNSSGRIVYRHPFDFRDDSLRGVASFNTSFTFQIVRVFEDGNSGIGPGAGMAFMLVPEANMRLPKNSYGFYMGLLNETMQGNNSTHMLAVEFDDVLNTDVGDPSASHAGVDINSVISVATANLTGEFNLTANYTLTAWIEYDATTDCLEVRMASNSTERPREFLLRTNFSSRGWKLSGVLNQERMYVGFSAATGQDCFQFHRLYAWNFTMSRVTKCNGVDCAVVKVLVALSVALALVLMVALAMVVFRRTKKIAYTIHMPESVGITRFSFKELRSATRGFSKKLLLGRGGFASVYKGTLKDRTAVAIKYLNRDKAEADSESSIAQFVAEIRVIGQLRHRNLVGLKGFCFERAKFCLVYEYMPNTSLDKHLFDPKGKLEWHQRLAILRGVAEGLAFLHEGWQQRVLHRDVKAANVLLDASFGAKLGDFGFSKLVDHGTGSWYMTAVGTTGYMAPELYTGRATERSDVYSFGILALEVVSGRRATSLSKDKNDEDSVLLDWVRELACDGRDMEAVDARLHEAAARAEDIVRAIRLGLHCCQLEPYKRPTMRACCQLLQSNAACLEAPPMPAIVSSPSVRGLSLDGSGEGFNVDDDANHSS
ncbi:L-type lectin-domain containing receptor kinase IV.2 [Selaginella moellendorffii]|nr:L-type lectin-domain containing receptor kinase IV.2 [Selaginella moellendorffii]|eukprot:XP_002984130.2 L-type lectin-domain containing receptor kinase IV.2 [Selaginella moellendorffii]